MPERAALDLSGILNQYRPLRPPEPERPILDEDPQDPLRFAVPVKLGRGALTWSTSTALLPVENPCYDVNGYYRELGVHWRATRKELAQAYTDLDGQQFPRLTYIFKQLLNPKIREAYDRAPQGEPFLDAYTDEQLKRRAHTEAHCRVSKGEDISAAQIMDEWGYTLLTDDEVDSVSPIGKDLIYGDDPWEYSYYAWKTSTYLPDVHRLRRWQELLSTAASQRGVSPRMVIGTTAVSDQPFMLEDVNGNQVIFFSEDASPTLLVAHEAIENYLRFSPHLTHLQHLSAEGEIT
jgi:hypothetical protein